MLLHLMLAAQEYSYKRYTVDDGLPTNTVYGGLQDSRGYIWFYTEKGISRFDGYEFKNYTVKDGLPANDIFYMTEDNARRLWLHSFAKDLVILDLMQDRFITLASEKAIHWSYPINANGDEVWAIKYGGKRVVTKKGQSIDTIYRKNPEWGNLLNEGFSVNTAYHYHPSLSLGFLEESGKAYLAHIDGKIADTFYFKNLSKEEAIKLNNRTFKSFQPYQNGLYIRAPKDSLVYYLNVKTKEVHRINLVHHLGGNPNFVRFYLQDSYMQIQTDLGLIIEKPGDGVVDVFLPKLPPGITLDRIFKDRQGNIWVTSQQKGVYFLTAMERNALLAIPSKREDNAISSLAYEDQALYAGTQNGNVYKVSMGLLQFTSLYEGPPALFNDATEIKDIEVTPEGLWFIRQSDGIKFLDFITGRVKPLLQKTENYDLKANASFRKRLDWDDQTGRLAALGKAIDWVEKKNKLLVARSNYSYECTINNQKEKQIRILAIKRAYDVVEGSDNTIWLAHNDGLGSYKNDKYTFHEEISQLNGRNIWDLEISSDNTLWAGTDGYGLVAYNGQNAYTIKGTENDIIQDVFIENKDYIWIATNYGVKQIQLAEVLENAAVSKVFDVNAGLVTREANCVVANSQYVFVGTNEGLTRINRQFVYADSSAPSLYLDSLLVNGVKTVTDRPIRLSYNQNELEFYYTALSFKSFGQLTYHYQLEGADRQEQSTSGRLVRYSNLPPGDYRFQLRASDIQNVDSNQLEAVRITILPPWWKTPLAFILAALALILITAGIYLWRIAQIRRKADWETSINKQFAELELQALQSQMNPHFVFNSLGAIQYFIQSNKKELADDYLARFGHLMRLFLESSKNRYISLAEEIKILNLYIQLEQTRFKNKFSYRLHVDEAIEPHSTFIPSMLLQPFVENAINHGLFHKKEAGELTIDFQVKNDTTICIIEDNGIGREEAGQIRLRSNKSYKSRAMQITQERLKALKRFEDFDIHFDIIDLYDENGMAQGTRVIIHIPEID